jgi:hypothetical protein
MASLKSIYVEALCSQGNILMENGMGSADAMRQTIKFTTTVILKTGNGTD